MELRLARCTLRSLRPGDAPAIATYANNRNIWINVRDRFPHPYHVAHARQFIRMVRGTTQECDFGIEIEGEIVGGVGFVIQPDVQRVSAEVGYWLGEPFWGRGIATEALAAITRHAIDTHRLTRLFAVVFDYNAASARVLEKCGYQLEARLPRSAIKNGRVIDQLQYGYRVPEPATI